MSSDAEKVVRRSLVEFFVFNSIYLEKTDPTSTVNRIKWTRMDPYYERKGNAGKQKVGGGSKCS